MHSICNSKKKDEMRNKFKETLKYNLGKEPRVIAYVSPKLIK